MLSGLSPRAKSAAEDVDLCESQDLWYSSGRYPNLHGFRGNNLVTTLPLEQITPRVMRYQVKRKEIYASRRLTTMRAHHSLSGDLCLGSNGPDNEWTDRASSRWRS